MQIHKRIQRFECLRQTSHTFSTAGIASGAKSITNLRSRDFCSFFCINRLGEIERTAKIAHCSQNLTHIKKTPTSDMLVSQPTLSLPPHVSALTLLPGSPHPLEGRVLQSFQQYPGLFGHCQSHAFESFTHLLAGLDRDLHSAREAFSMGC